MRNQKPENRVQRKGNIVSYSVNALWFLYSGFCTLNKTPKKAFTLVEIMVTAAVLSLGAVMIYGTFFTILDTFNYCSDYLALAPRMDEKIWQTQDYLRNFGPEAVIETEGAMSCNNKVFNWSLSYGVTGANDTRILYGIELAAILARGPNKVRLSRSGYAMYKYEEEE